VIEVPIADQPKEDVVDVIEVPTEESDGETVGLTNVHRHTPIPIFSIGEVASLRPKPGVGASRIPFPVHIQKVGKFVCGRSPFLFDHGSELVMTSTICGPPCCRSLSLMSASVLSLFRTSLSQTSKDMSTNSSISSSVGSSNTSFARARSSAAMGWSTTFSSTKTRGLMWIGLGFVSGGS